MPEKAEASAPTAGRVTTIPDYGFVRVSGNRAAEFLQGQLTCNVAEASPQQALAAAACDPKGRVFATLMLYPWDAENVILRMPRRLIDSFIGTMSRYAQLSRVELADESDAWCCVGLLDAQQLALPDELTAERATGRGASLRSDDTVLVCCNEDGSRFEYWLPTGQRDERLAALGTRLSPCSPELWQLRLIREGVVELCPELVDQFLPQMLNLELTGAVSFRKGCYTGQEIVARAQYRGQVKRRCYRASARAVASIAPATAVLRCEDGRQAGLVVQAAPAAPENWEMLVVLGDRDARQATLRLGAANGAELGLLDLPYTT